MGQEWPPLSSINKVLLEHSHSCFLIYYLCPSCATTGKLKSYNRDSKAHKTYNIFYLTLCQNKFVDSPSTLAPHPTPTHQRNRKPQGSMQEGQCKPVRVEKQGGQQKRGTQRGYWEEGVEETGMQRAMWGSTEIGAGQQDHLRGMSDLRRQQIPSLKSSPETYRPECKSWCESNSSWNICSALYARMVQSPRREDAKRENTGLRAGEAETDIR